jgi:hypothetical protein
MCGSNPNEALNLPTGSVRAILALIIIPPVILGAVALMILMFLSSQYTSALGVLSGLTGIAGSVVGYYFGVNSANKVTAELTKHLQAKDDIISSKNDQLTQNLLMHN